MSDFRARLWSVQWMEDGAEKSKQSEILIKEAQQLNDLDLEYEARTVHMQAVAYNGEPEKELACFPWLLAMNDKYPGRFDLSEVLWYYKWVVVRVAKFPSISKERIMDIMEDMERRYVTAGYGRKTILYFRRQIYQDFGDPESAEKAHQEWQQADENPIISDCTACVINTMVDYEKWQGNYAEAIEKAQDLLDKKYTCADVPLRTFEQVIISHVHLNQLKEALPVYRKAASKLKYEKARLTDFGNIIIYLTLTENDVRAKNAFVKQLPFALSHGCEYYIQEFYIGVLFFLTALQSKNKQEISIAKRVELPVAHKNHTYQIADLITFFENEIDRITQLFNQRNGNDFYTQKKERVMALLPNRRKVSLS